MAKYRNALQTFATVSSLVSYTEVTNRKGDKVYVTEIGKELIWVTGSTLAHDGKSVIDQTSESANGRWEAPTASIKALSGSIAVPSFDNGQKEVLTAIVAGLPVGTAVTVSATNAATAYGGASIPEGIRFDFSNSIKVADTIEVEVSNETGLDDTTAFTLNFTVSKL